MSTTTNAPSQTEVANKVGLRRKIAKIFLLAATGILASISGLGGGVALTNGKPVVGIILAVSFLTYFAVFVGVTRDEKWGYWVAFIIGILQIVGGITSSGIGAGLSFGVVFVALSAERLFHPDA